MTINIDEDEIGYSEIKTAVDKAGYKLIKEEEQVQEKKKLEASQLLLRRFIISLIFAIPLLVITMGHMLGMPLPYIIDSMMNPLNFAMIQLVLTIPVMIAGYKFYLIGIKNLFKLSPNMDSLIAISTLAAVLYGIFGIYKIQIGETEYAMHLYFESAAVILTLITLENIWRQFQKEEHHKLLKH